MILKQIKPIARNPKTTSEKSRGELRSVQPSNIACDICKAGCSLLSGVAKTLCLAACEATVC